MQAARARMKVEGMLLVALFASALAGCGPGPWILAALGVSGDTSSGGGGEPAPALAVESPARTQTGGVAEISFTLAHPSGKAADVLIEYSLGGETFFKATPAAAAPGASAPANAGGEDDATVVASNPALLEAPPGGRRYRFRWSTGDPGDRVPNSADVFVAVTARVAGRSARLVTRRFAVANEPLSIGEFALPRAQAVPPGNRAPRAPAYAFDLAPFVSGGLPPYRFSVRFDIDPRGLSIDEITGILSGDPIRSGLYRVTVEVDDVVPSTVARTATLEVAQAIEIVAGALPPATPGQADYAEPIAVRGGEPGTSGYRFAIVAPTALPPGLGLDEKTGLVSGAAPADEGMHAFRVRATDAEGFSTEREMKLAVRVPRPVARAARYDSRNGLNGFAVGDLDGDGLDDLVQATIPAGPPPPPSSFDPRLVDPPPATPEPLVPLELIAYLGDGAGGFDFERPVALASGTLGSPGVPIVRLGRLSGGARPPEIVVLGENTIALFESTGAVPARGATGPFYRGRLFFTPKTGLHATGLALGNFTPGGGDIAAAFQSGAFGEETAELFLVRGALDEAASPVAVTAFASVDTSLAAGDLDGEGLAELVFAGRLFAYDAAADLPVERMRVPLETIAIGRLDGRRDRDVIAGVASEGSEHALTMVALEGNLADGSAALVPVDGALARLPAGERAPVSGIVAGEFGPGGEAGLAVGVNEIGVFLVRLTEGGTLEPSCLDHPAQAATTLVTFSAPVGAARLRRNAPQSVIFDRGSAFPEIFALAPDGSRLDTATGFVFDLPEEFLEESRGDLTFPPVTRLLGVLDSGRPDLVFAFADGVAIAPLDEEGRPEGLVPIATGAANDVAILDDATSKTLIVLRPGGEIERFGPVGEGVIPSPMGDPIAAVPGQLLLAGDLDGAPGDELVIYRFRTEDEPPADVFPGELAVVRLDPQSPNTTLIQSLEVPLGPLSAFGLPDAALVDFDRDGALDLFLGFNGEVVAILRGRGDGTLEPADLHVVSGPVVFVKTILADLEGDGDLDAISSGLAVVSHDFGFAAFIAENENGSLRLRESVTFPSDVLSLLPPAALDLDLDGELEIVIFDGEQAFVLRRSVDGLRVSESFSIADHGNDFFGVHAADLDGDGCGDVTVARPGTVRTLFGDGRGGFRRAPPLELGPCKDGGGGGGGEGPPPPPPPPGP